MPPAQDTTRNMLQSEGQLRSWKLKKKVSYNSPAPQQTKPWKQNKPKTFQTCKVQPNINNFLDNLKFHTP